MFLYTDKHAAVHVGWSCVPQFVFVCWNHRDDLKQVPAGCFLTAMTLSRSHSGQVIQTRATVKFQI